MPADPAADTIGLVIQLSVAPIFLLVGTGSFLNVMTSRLGRVVDRARALEDLIDAGESEEEQRRHRAELCILDRRIVLANRAIASCCVSALLICFVVVLLFVGEFLDLPIRVAVASLFIATVLFLTVGLSQFLREISLATGTLRVRNEFLARAMPPSDKGV